MTQAQFKTGNLTATTAEALQLINEAPPSAAFKTRVRIDLAAANGKNHGTTSTFDVTLTREIFRDVVSNLLDSEKDDGALIPLTVDLSLAEDGKSTRPVYWIG